MSALYDVTAHVLLSGGAKYLTPTELDAHASVAESLLGFAGLSVFSGESLDKAKQAVALQVSFQVEGGIDAAVVQSKTEGVRSMTYRADLVHRMALVIAQSIIGVNTANVDDFTPVRSLRGTGNAPRREFSTSVLPDEQHYR